jgi:hypothetical protein
LTSVPAFAAISVGLAGCGDDVTPEAPVPPVPPPPVVTYPKMTFITQDPAFSDYRPAVDSTGLQYLFERTPVGTGNTTLYRAVTSGTSPAVVTSFLAVPANPAPSFPYSQTRPDWSWATGEVAFSGAPSETATIEVHLVAGTGVNPRVVPNTLAHIYPIWTSDGTQLVVYNNSKSASPVQPVTGLITPNGTVIVANLNGPTTATPPVPLFGGFAAPKPGTPTQIAFAGQPALATWGVPTGTTPPAAPVYNQDNNYVFLNASSQGGYVSKPLEPAASVTTYNPAYQGRAPYWSPDGKYLVFESSRAGGYALFLADVAKVAAGAAPVQLTDVSYWAQHAKFLPGGRSVVFTALQKPSAAGTGPRGIVTIDISAYL